ncbi:MAG: ASPIC/UnbV domain-containing protein [Flammeovirgaceae bacterium]|nr:ASPIC/UnbV domain-containing protein [Flammeovirgaceae bacterium]
MSQGGSNKFLKVRFQKNAKNLGAIVSVTAAGKTLTDFLYSGEGLSSDQSSTLIFGFSDLNPEINHLTINYLSGKIDTVRNVTANSAIEIK